MNVGKYYGDKLGALIGAEKVRFPPPTLHRPSTDPAPCTLHLRPYTQTLHPRPYTKTLDTSTDPTPYTLDRSYTLDRLHPRQ